MKKIIFLAFFTCVAYSALQIKDEDKVHFEFVNFAHEPGVMVITHQPFLVTLSVAFACGQHPISLHIKNESDSSYVLARKSFSLPVITDMDTVATMASPYEMASGIVGVAGLYVMGLIYIMNKFRIRELFWPSICTGTTTMALIALGKRDHYQLAQKMKNFSFTSPLLIKPHTSITKIVWLDAAYVATLLDQPLTIALFDKETLQKAITVTFSMGNK